MRSPSQATLERARAMNRANLPDTCTAVLRGENTDDGEGGFIFAPDILVPFSCRVQSSGPMPAETLLGDQLREPGTATLAYDAGFDLPMTARVTIQRSGGVTETYDVIGRQVDPTYLVMRRVVIRLVSPPDAAEAA